MIHKAKPRAMTVSDCISYRGDLYNVLKGIYLLAIWNAIRNRTGICYVYYQLEQSMIKVYCATRSTSSRLPYSPVRNNLMLRFSEIRACPSVRSTRSRARSAGWRLVLFMIVAAFQFKHLRLQTDIFNGPRSKCRCRWYKWFNSDG